MDWSARLLPRGTTALLSDSGHRIALDPSGFGLCLSTEEVSLEGGFNAASVAEIIRTRRTFHSEVCSGFHELADLCLALREAATECLSRAELRRCRPHLWRTPPYVLSIYFLETGAPLNDWLNDETRRCLGSLLEPTRLEESVRHLPKEEQRRALSRSIRTNGPVDAVESGRSIDHSVDTLAFASWAGLVVASESSNDGRRLQYEGLEIRAQLAWSIAHYLRSWADAIADGDEDDIIALNRVEAKAMPRIRNLARLSTGTTRQAGIFEAISATAGLEREIETAERTLELAHRSYEYRIAERNERYNRAIEVLLALVAVSQVLPLVADQPMIRASPLAVVSGLSLLVALILYWQRTRG